MRLRDRDEDTRIGGDDQTVVGRGGGRRNGAATMHVDVLAGLVRRASVIVLRRVTNIVIMVLIMVLIMIVGRMAVQSVRSVGMRVERRQHRRIAAQAGGAQCNGNHGKTQDLASQKAHILEKPEEFRPIKAHQPAVLSPAHVAFR